METNVDKDNSQNEFFFNKGGKVRMENIHPFEIFWVDYHDIWKKIESNFDGNDEYTRKLIRSMVGDAFKMRSFPTYYLRNLCNLWWEMHSK